MPEVCMYCTYSITYVHVRISYRMHATVHYGTLVVIPENVCTYMPQVHMYIVYYVHACRTECMQPFAYAVFRIAFAYMQYVRMYILYYVRTCMLYRMYATLRYGTLVVIPENVTENHSHNVKIF